MACAAPVFSQAPGNDEDELQEVTVTANRIAENLQKVPLTITAITGAELAQQNIQNVDDVFKSAPDVVFYRTAVGGGQNSELVIRGIQSSTGEGTTGVYIDDTPIQLHKGGISFTAQNDYPDIFDLDRVEILEGPQGTLFGEGAMGGAVRFITRQPSLDTYSVYAKVSNSFTDYGDPSYSIGAAAGGPIIDNVLGFRISMDYHRDGGYVSHTSDQDYSLAYEQGQAGYEYGNSNDVQKYSNWGETSSFRLAFTYEPVDGLTITPSYTYQYRYSNAQSQFYNMYSNVSAGDFENVTGVPEPEYDNFELPALTVRYNLPGIVLFSNTSYYYRNERDYYNNTDCDLDCTPAAVEPTVGFPLWYPNDPTLATNLWDHNQQKNFTQEFRVQSPDSSARFTWQGGLYYSHDVAQSQEYAPLTLATYNGIAQSLGYASGYALFGFNLLPGDLSYNTLDLVTDTHYAVFGEASYKPIKSLTLTVGLRAERINSALISEQGGPYAERATVSGYSTEISATPVTPKFSAAYQINDDNMVYATIAQGARPGGSNGPLPAICGPALAASGLAGLNGAYKGDSVWSYEIGAKDKFADNRVVINSSFYWINWTNIQESIPLDAAGGDCIQNVTANGNSLTSKGASIQAQALLIRGLTLSGSVGWDEALFNHPLYGEGPTGPVVIINKDDGLDGAPPLTSSLAIQYDRTLFDRPSFARFDYHYISEERVQPGEDPVDSTYYSGNLVRPVTNVANFRTGMTFDRFQAQIFVTNLTDAHPLYQTNNGQASNGIELQSITIRPRTIGVAGIYSF